MAQTQAISRPGHRRLTGVRAWPIWQLQRWLRAFIAAVVVADALVFLLSARDARFSGHDLLLFGLLLACSAATVEITRRAGENNGVVKDVFATWELPAAILLPLIYVPVLPAVRMALTQWRIQRTTVYRRVFSAAVVGLSYVAAAFTFRFLVHPLPAAYTDPDHNALAWMLIAAVSAAVQWTVNQVLLCTAIKGSYPALRIRDEVLSKEHVFNDVTELCVAVIVSFCVAASAIALLFAFPFITLLQRSLRHSRLLKDSRLDAKTGLLNAGTWERHATTEVARAVRTRTSLAIALLDIDRFKVINDTYGHLVGDQVLKEISRTLTSLLRDYDLAGRFGGEEFSMILPQTRAVDAIRIAERIRSGIAGLSVIAPGAVGGERVQFTVSIGVAALDAGTERTYGQLMAAADAALYRAKNCGRDQVQMISTTRGLSAVSGTSSGINADARDLAERDHQEPDGQAVAEPGVFHRAMTSLAGRTSLW